MSTDSYTSDERFAHHSVADDIVAEVGIRSMVAAPMFANQQPLGVLGVFSSRPDAFNEQQQSLLRSLAEHAAAAIDNRHLLRQLRDSEEQLRSQAAELERTVAAHRALDEIARRIVDVADASEVLQQVVDTASGLLGSDGAHLTLMGDESNVLVPIVMAGHTEPGTRAWLNPVARLFHMRIDMGHVLPMVGRDSYLDGRGAMHGRLLGIVPVADAEGPELDVSELTTWVNDAVLLAPSMLLGSHSVWQELDDDSFSRP